MKAGKAFNDDDDHDDGNVNGAHRLEGLAWRSEATLARSSQS